MDNDADAPDIIDVVERFDELGLALYGEEDEPTDSEEEPLDLEREKTPQEAFKNLSHSVYRYLAALENKLDGKDREIGELRCELERSEQKLGALIYLTGAGCLSWLLVLSSDHTFKAADVIWATVVFFSFVWFVWFKMRGFRDTRPKPTP